MNNNEHNNIRHIVIAGGGTAGWMAAAALASTFNQDSLEITLVESSEIPTIGVGEATIPPIDTFNRVVKISTQELLQKTNGTIKLGIQFDHWQKVGKSYFHPFGAYGTDFHNLPFSQFWIRAKLQGFENSLDQYSLNTLAAHKGVYTDELPTKNSPLAKFNRAYHFDASKYAALLKEKAKNLGVKHIIDTIDFTEINKVSGNIDSLTLSSGAKITGDFFIDCTGFKGLLIEEALNTGYEDWSDLLPCDSAYAVPSERLSEVMPYTTSTAHTIGWQWKIPLQHRTGNGLVYSSKYCSDEQARLTLEQNLPTPALSSPRHIRFKTGKRKKIWNKNCLSIGLASGFIEPLESTSIHLIQSVISRFLGLFPPSKNFQAEQDRLNMLINREMLSIRDFILLHYCATERDDSAFWRHFSRLEKPESLKQKIALFQSSGQLYRDDGELFSDASWLAVMHGQGITPKGYNPLADQMSESELKDILKKITNATSQSLQKMQNHEEFIDKYCRAPAN